MTLIGLSIVVSNLQAQNIKPENYGQKNILFKIAKYAGNYWEDEILFQKEIKEGPISKLQAPTSYLEDTAITSKKASSEKHDEGIDTLISTTQDESALIAPDITDPEVVVKKRDKIIDYVVKPGDAISTIAAKFGITTNTILWENNLSYYSLIKPGQTLKILPLAGISYKVKKGDTLKSIAKEYKGKVDEIMEFNKLASDSDIHLDQLLVIPGGEKQTVYTSSYSVKTIFSPPAKVSSTKLQWPTNSYRITQYYNWRHHAIDIGSQTGQPIYAAESGKITAAGWNNGGYGYYVIIDHGGGLKTLYAHLSRIYVKVGQNVTRGQVISAIGSTGRSTGPHLHFEVVINGVKLNPLEYIR